MGFNDLSPSEIRVLKIICGLGNPGREYERHRHNIGFQITDAIASALRAPWSQEKFEAQLALGNARGEKILLLKPQTFMNLSGQSLGAAARFYKVPAADVLVVHDDMDLPLGRLQLKGGGGSGGHNGLKSILSSWGEESFARLRVGIGKPGQGREKVVGHVLGAFGSDEKQAVQDLLERATEAALCWAQEGLAAAMNQYNRRSP